MSVQFQEGQTVFYVPDDKRQGGPRPVIVRAIGRKWVSVDSLWSTARFDKHTLRMDGGGYSSPGRVYASLEGYEAEQDRERAWAELRNKVASYHIPYEATAQRIRLALGLLRMGGDTDPLAVVQALTAKLPEEHVTAYFAREELAAVRRLFGTSEPAKPVSGASKS